MSNQRILVVDDDKEIVRVLRTYLEQSGYEVFTAYDGNTALHILMRERPDLVVLDLMLPDKDGLDITRLLRSEPALARIYVLMLTARVEDTDKVVGLEVGADDYVTKPFNPREIVARVRSALRRVQLDKDLINQDMLRYEGLVVDLARRRVTLHEKALDLTPTEFNLLIELMRRPGVPVTRADLVQKRLGYDYESLERTLDTHVRNLRKKLEHDPANPVYIQTVYGIGYKLGEG
ncbi:MAG: response regulator transcription factor [Anaerolineae bacterium]|nr:response regulator transcription factor [Anaerolineae bacterium]